MRWGRAGSGARTRLAVALSFVLACGLGGCAPSPEAARRELAAIGVEYTPVAFLKAAANGDVRAVELFLLTGMEVDTEGPLTIKAVMSGVYGKTALVLAVRSGRMDMVRVLLDAGADPNTAVRDACLFLRGEERLEMVRVLIDAGADPDAVLGEDGSADRPHGT